MTPQLPFSISCDGYFLFNCNSLFTFSFPCYSNLKSSTSTFTFLPTFQVFLKNLVPPHSTPDFELSWGSAWPIIVVNVALRVSQYSTGVGCWISNCYRSFSYFSRIVGKTTIFKKMVYFFIYIINIIIFVVRRLCVNSPRCHTCKTVRSVINETSSWLLLAIRRCFLSRISTSWFFRTHTCGYAKHDWSFLDARISQL